MIRVLATAQKLPIANIVFFLLKPQCTPNIHHSPISPLITTLAAVHPKMAGM
jgi:hypothetical protein